MTEFSAEKGQHSIVAAVFLDGEDITRRACWFRGPDQPGAEGQGEARVAVLNNDGTYKAVRDEAGNLMPVYEWWKGVIRWERRKNGSVG